MSRNAITIGKRFAMLLAALLLAGSTGACWELDAYTDPECEGMPPEDVEGTWTIRGSGRRYSCTEDELNTDDLSMRSMPLQICQQEATFALSSELYLPDTTFEVTATLVEGRCVTFTTVEEGPNGVIYHDFRGKLSGSRITGDWDSTGPVGCRGRGKFTATIAR